ncbi:MAG: hypothetical protein JJE22_05395 [Bacteroidia bacterium]|nr:hypothetical protein [Bacteroidia bacterium]
MSNKSVAAPDRMLFLTCFIALVTTSFGFILRAIVLPERGIKVSAVCL